MADVTARFGRIFAMTLLAVAGAAATAVAAAPATGPASSSPPPLYAGDFSAAGYGNVPPVWVD
jgi:hypothetical protein